VTSLVLATANPGKVVELRRLLPRSLEVLGLSDVAAYEPGPETGATFAENALAKAVEAVQATGLPAVADDSGLVVDALNGMPGVLSARWAGRHGDDRTSVPPRGVGHGRSGRSCRSRRSPCGKTRFSDALGVPVRVHHSVDRAPGALEVSCRKLQVMGPLDS